ncbi:MAG: hypothetical protein Unbinned6004contig1002_40 [Prokaryotic dsDNA virus sp.]|nr:MAG: hypothetical protein Unbinned6004contig1002_40 [Prokaryotic dsDNA virus sp.]|tara:strand:- start:3693 stop:3854 length:162 start_codon:yes stop_codon:yes gene_type:complete
MSYKEIDKILNSKNTIEDQEMWIELNDKLVEAKNDSEIKLLMIEYIPKIFKYV